MNYCKIDSRKKAVIMPNPVKLSIANPSDIKKSLIAQLDGWFEMVCSQPPEYDPETQYVVDYWEEADGKAVQHWEIREIEIPPEDSKEEEGWSI